MPKITFLPSGVTIDVQAGTTVFNAAARAEVAIASQCGGKGACALCRVKLSEGAELVSPMRWDEEGHLGNAFFVTRERLSCQLQAWGDVTIEVSEAPVKEKQRGRYMPRSLIRKREKMEQEAELERVRGEGRRAGKEGGRPPKKRSEGRRGGPGDRPPRPRKSNESRPPRPPRNAPPASAEDVAARRDGPRHVATAAKVPVDNKPPRRRRRRRRRSGGARPGDSRPPPGADKPKD